MVASEKVLGQKLTAKGNERTFWGDRNILYFDRCLGYTGKCICQSSLNGGFTVQHFTYVKKKKTTNNIELQSIIWAKVFKAEAY